MSRIDEALRRAANAQGVCVEESAQPVTSAEQAFRSPWQFPAMAEPRPEAVPAQASREASAEVFPAETVTPPAPPPVAAPDLSRTGGLGRIETVAEGFNAKWNDRLVSSPNADPVFVEQFRRVAVTLHHSQVAQQTKVLLVTSASPGDGKTMTAINLALILSQSFKRRVLLIDGDLRRPAIRDIGNLRNVVGLTEALHSSTEQKVTVLRVNDRLMVLPAGRPNPDPTSGLTSVRMRQILEDASASFDWVIVDAPPAATVPDSSLLSSLVDAVLLVVRAGHTQCPLVKMAIEAVGQDRILGVLLNGSQEPPPEGSGYYAAQVGPDERVQG